MNSYLWVEVCCQMAVNAINGEMKQNHNFSDMKQFIFFILWGRHHEQKSSNCC